MTSAIITDDEPLARERIRSLIEERGDIEIIGECKDGKEAVAAILDQRPDLVFLDIQMPEMDGFEVIAAINDEYLPAIIFITAFDQYALRAFEVNAIDYLLKPINPARFEKAVERALDRLSRSEKIESDKTLRDFIEKLQAERGYTARFVVRNQSKLYFILASDVDWIDSAANYARLHVSGKEHLVRETLKSIEARLNPEIFVRVHRSAIINIERVTSVEPHFHGEYVVTMADGARLTTSRTQSSKLRAILRQADE
ncbi:MAG TPA: response regulator [Blastocatellia bacterium]|jgi:two-component system LytT family response regulator